MTVQASQAVADLAGDSSQELQNRKITSVYQKMTLIRYCSDAEIEKWIQAENHQGH